MRPNIQIISRATRDRNIKKLYTAGADLVMSYASLGANRILNVLKPNEILLLAEGLSVFKLSVPAPLIDKRLSESQIREKSGCNVVAIYSDDAFNINPDPSVQLKKKDELILIGTAEAERKFIDFVS